MSTNVLSLHFFQLACDATFGSRVRVRARAFACTRSRSSLRHHSFSFLFAFFSFTSPPLSPSLTLRWTAFFSVGRRGTPSHFLFAISQLRDRAIARATAFALLYPHFYRLTHGLPLLLACFSSPFHLRKVLFVQAFRTISFPSLKQTDMHFVGL